MAPEIELKTASEHLRRLSIAGLILKLNEGRKVRHALTPWSKHILNCAYSFRNQTDGKIVIGAPSRSDPSLGLRLLQPHGANQTTGGPGSVSQGMRGAEDMNPQVST